MTKNVKTLLLVTSMGMGGEEEERKYGVHLLPQEEKRTRGPYALYVSW